MNGTMKNKLKISPVSFAAILDSYGADRSRWPAEMRAALEEYISRSKSAQTLVREAGALERTLNASQTVAASSALKARIMTSVTGDAEKPAKVVPISVVKPSILPAGIARPYWSAAALAASFAIGLYLGIDGIVSKTVDDAVQVSGLVSTDYEVENGIWLDIVAGASGEDIL